MDFHHTLPPECRLSPDHVDQAFQPDVSPQSISLERLTYIKCLHDYCGAAAGANISIVMKILLHPIVRAIQTHRCVEQHQQAIPTRCQRLAGGGGASATI